METNDLSPEEWYTEERPQYKRLTDAVRSTLERLLADTQIEYLNVSGRTKSHDSFAEKIERKGYSRPSEQVMDLSGIRVITFIEADIAKVVRVIEGAFNVHEDESLDKSSELDADRFGYRSYHLVCDLGQARAELPEFEAYESLLFEIQVRTVLQHAWAEIEHDRNYKLSGLLPEKLRRRLYSIAGMLEIADREFNSLAQDLDEYAATITEKTEAGELDVELNSTSLKQFIKQELESSDLPYLVSSYVKTESAIAELEDYGVQTLGELKGLMNGKLKAIDSTENETTLIGLIRSVLMLEDIDKYFDIAWKGRWQGMPHATERMLSEKYDADKIREIVKANDIDRLPPKP